MGFDYTSEQKKAIDVNGNTLVSAAAGSGKTAVLVERVVKKLIDKQNPVSADSLLIVTFTNAAAAEMRTRIEKRLDAECREHPEDTALLKQRQLISSAKICTIDSFCIDLVRESFEKAGVSPDFKISEQNSLVAVNEYVLSKLLNEYYEQKNPDFFALMEIIGAEYGDDNFSSYLLDMYNYSRQLAYPLEWFSSLAEMYSENAFKKGNKWYDYAVKAACNAAYDMRRISVSALDFLTEDEDAYSKYSECFKIGAEGISRLLAAAEEESFDGIFGVLEDFYLPGIPPARKPLAKLAKTARDNILDVVADLKVLFYDSEENIRAEFKKIYKPVVLLSEILTELDKRLFEEYLSRNILTFHNTEHLALKLLTSEEGKRELGGRYTEVCVDEYQDTNDLQDMLFEVLSDGGKKLFAVGDVKQSIYGFRGARPMNFLNKVNAAEYSDKAKENEAKKIILGNNFRSRKEICDYINFFFENMMTAKTGSIVYNDDEKLIPTAEFPEPEGASVSFDILEMPYKSEDKLTAEADRIADYIKSVMSGAPSIRESKTTLRRAVYSDFTVLLRNTKGKAAVIAKRLEENGIPVNYSIEEYAETTEISVFLSLLRVIDNPESDIELLSLLLSPIFGFTPDEAANLRIKCRNGSLYSALIFSAENGDEHSVSTLKALEKYRLLSVTLTLPRLVSRLLRETDYLNTVSAMKDGARRRGNLLMLVGLAEKYTSETAGSLYGFVKFVLKQSENGIKSAATVSGSDTVKIMSIHASKGLQFPICIIAGTGYGFNDSEVRDTAVYSSNFGIGFKYFDEDKKQKLTTIGREVILHNDRRNTREEELRLIYVAMTRAEDKLHFTANVSKLGDTVENNIKALTLYEGKQENLFDNMNSYYKWLLSTSLMHPDGAELRGTGRNIIVSDTESHISISYSEYEEKPLISENVGNKDYVIDNDIADKIKENLAFRYPFADLLSCEAKSSVSALANKAESEKYAFSAKPSFMSDGGITAAERGTATHKIMEFIDFSKADDLESEIERLYEYQFITEREAEAVNREKLREFFASNIFARIKASPKVKREMRFLTELPAERVEPSLKGKYTDENVIVQGAVDLCFEEDGEMVVLDFKTDRADKPEALAEAYGEQLSIYAAACEKIFEKRVKQKIIYSFALSREIEI